MQGGAQLAPCQDVDGDGGQNSHEEDQQRAQDNARLRNRQGQGHDAWEAHMWASAGTRRAQPVVGQAWEEGVHQRR